MEVVELLGVYLDEGQKWKFYIDNISKDMAESLLVFNRTNIYKENQSKKNIYSSLIYPTLTYCITI